MTENLVKISSLIKQDVNLNFQPWRIRINVLFVIFQWMRIFFILRVKNPLFNDLRRLYFKQGFIDSRTCLGFTK